MSEDKEKSEELETEAAQLIDKVPSDEGELDKAALLLAESEKLKGSVVKKKSE